MNTIEDARMAMSVGDVMDYYSRCNSTHEFATSLRLRLELLENMEIEPCNLDNIIAQELSCIFVARDYKEEIGD